MPSDSNEAFGDEDDHLLAGTNFLRRIGHNIDKTWTASAGLDEDGHPQVLVIGFNNIQLVNEKGKVVLDVGSRNIRALRSVNTGGLQLCTTTNVATENFRTRWPHYISVEDAQYLENLWLDLFPPQSCWTTTELTSMARRGVRILCGPRRNGGRQVRRRTRWVGDDGVPHPRPFAGKDTRAKRKGTKG